VTVSATDNLITPVIDNEKLDLIVPAKSDSYTRARKRGVRFYLFDDNWLESRRLIDKVDKEYQEIA